MIPYTQNQISELDKIIYSLNSEGRNPDLRNHMHQWSRNKSSLYKLFGNKLRIEQEVNSTVSDITMTSLIESFCEMHCRDNPKMSMLEMFLYNPLLTSQELKTNILDKDLDFLGMIYKKGMKISRILPKLVEKKYSDFVQIEYSKVLQEIKVKGKAVISIDPKDFLTMSENGGDWRSCQSLDGEYRTGTLAYMMDGVTAVAYVTTGEIKKPYYTIEKKVWRQLVYFNTNYAVQSRQYPSTNINNVETISNMIVELMGADKYKSQEYAVGRLVELDLILDCEEYNNDSNMWYNDIRKEAFSKCNIILPKEYEDLGDLVEEGKTELTWVGVQEIPCACGCDHILEEADTLFCSDEEEYDYEEENEEDE